jgi:hypothetical protein
VIQRLVKRLPDHASEIRRAVGGDTFRDMCDGLAIALETLLRVEARASAETCLEIPEYKVLIVELEDEISAYLARRGAH